MKAPNMATITASIERSLQNFSLNHSHQSSSSSSSNSGGGRSASPHSPENLDPSNDPLELNSGTPLPYYWEQCLDLKTGEIYFINWRTGMKSQEDPRTNPEMNGDGNYYSEDDSSSCDSEGSSSAESSPSSSRAQPCQYYYNHSHPPRGSNEKAAAQVLVVAGCKSCLMYFMVPKQVEVCPKCYGQLLHFDRSENGSGSP